MDDEPLQRTAIDLALHRGLVEGDEATLLLGREEGLETWVRSGALGPESAERLMAEAALAAPGSSDHLGLFPLRRTERYRPELYLGDGGMGRVFRAYDTHLKRRVALKFFRTSLPREARILQREAQSQARIDHPHVAKVFEAGELEGFPFLSMQYIQGPTLARAAVGLSLREKVELVRQGCLGVHAGHRLGIIHRDLKPGNIMLERDPQGLWQAYVMDFGLARDLSDPEAHLSTTVMGTPAFMAPELIQGPQVLVGPHTDVYALGVTLYQMAAERLPFTGSTHAEVFHKVVATEAPPLRAQNPDLPRDLEAIVQRCMEKDLLRRYDSALDLAEDLQRYLDGVPVLARPVGPWRRLARRARRNPAALAAAILAAGLGLGWAVYASLSRALVSNLGQRMEAQGLDLARVRAELGSLRQAQAEERRQAQSFKAQVEEARTPEERRDAEERLRRSLERERTLALQVAQAEARLPTLRPSLPRPEAPAELPRAPEPPERGPAPARPEGEPPLLPPRMLRQAPVHYPPQARSSPLNPNQKRELSVLLQVQVDAGGRPRGVSVLEGIPGNWGFDEAAVAALWASTFTPATREGRPAAGSLTVRVNFPRVP